jgi:outer membrane immunogenic protein
MGRIVFTTALIACAAIGSARAADLPTKVPLAPVPAAAAYSWTGCYIGVEGGGNWGRSSETASGVRNPAVAGLPLTNEFDLRGALVGGTVGCNYQVGTWVFGIENDYSWTNKSGSANDIAPFNTRAVNTVSESWIDTLRGRIGFAWDRALIYGTGGVAFTDAQLTVCGAARCPSESQSRTGWVAGVGVEYAVWQSLSVKIEYLHADFGTTRYFNSPAIPTNFAIRDVRLSDDIIRAGLNWRFDWGAPVTARY